jgi:hypothetical protein
MPAYPMQRVCPDCALPRAVLDCDRRQDMRLVLRVYRVPGMQDVVLTLLQVSQMATE